MKAPLSRLAKAAAACAIPPKCPRCNLPGAFQPSEGALATPDDEIDRRARQKLEEQDVTLRIKDAGEEHVRVARTAPQRAIELLMQELSDAYGMHIPRIFDPHWWLDKKNP